MQIGTKLRYTDQELSLIKNSFADHEDLMALFRKFLLDGEMTEDEQKLLDGFTNSPAVVDVLEKAINPKLEKLAPAFQTVDLYSNFNFEPTPADHATLVLKGRNFAVKYLTQRFALLRKQEVKSPIKFDELTTPVAAKTVEEKGEANEKTYIHILARNFMLSHIDTQLFNSLMIIAGEKEETLEQQKKRLTMDSSK